MAKKKKNTREAPKKKHVTREEKQRNEEVKQWIWIVVLAAMAIIGYMQMGVIGLYLSRIMKFLFGSFYYVMMIVIILQIIITMVNRRNGNTSSKNPIAMVLIVVGILLLCAYTDTAENLKGFEILKQYARAFHSFMTQDTPDISPGGGITGALLLSLATWLVDRAGTVLIIIVLFVIALLLLVNLNVYKQAFHSIRDYFSTEDEEDDDDEEDSPAYEEPRQVDPEPIDIPEEPSARPLKMINVDDDTFNDVPTEPVEHLAIEHKSDSSTPQASSFGIDVDEISRPQEDKMPVEEEKAEEEDLKQETRSIFMNVDDLVDNTIQPASGSQEEVPEESIISGVEDELSSEAEPEAAQEEETVEKPEEKPVEEPARPQEETAPQKKKPYALPRPALLDPVPKKDPNDPNIAAAEEKGKELIDVLENFGIQAQLIDTHIGPSVTKFEIRPESTVKVSRILGLTDDIKMQMAVKDIRIEAPIPGHNAVGVEVPNVKATPVKMKELINDLSEKDKADPLTIFLGKDLLGNTMTCRLDKMPHLLIAGATGSGKSVCMNAIIISLLLRTKPDEVKLLLVDPKKVEFTPYQKIPHLIGPVINDPNQASNALKVIVKIMDERYDMFSKNGVRNIQGYNRMIEGMPERNPEDGAPRPKKLPYIVVIVDEMADLMNVAGKEVEGSIQRITQLARAAGIHLIIATQRPSVDVITGVIKANIPSRIAFAVSSAVDSKTILDHAGAERLLGNGDMLYMPAGASSPTRVQGVFVTDEEVERITDFVSKEAVPMYDDSFVRLEGVNDGEGDVGGIITANEDPLYEEIKKFVIQKQKASTSLLQRRFGIGYNRAARLIDALEENGVIGPQQGSKPREVFIKPDKKDDSYDEE